jgi:hypothetical protein
MMSTIFVGTTRKMSALTGALALVATVAVLLVSGASVANAQVNQTPNCGPFCQRIQTKICTVLRSLPAVNESPGGTDPLSVLIERVCGTAPVGE